MIGYCIDYLGNSFWSTKTNYNQPICFDHWLLVGHSHPPWTTWRPRCPSWAQPVRMDPPPTSCEGARGGSRASTWGEHNGFPPETTHKWQLLVRKRLVSECPSRQSQIGDFGWWFSRQVCLVVVDGCYFLWLTLIQCLGDQQEPATRAIVKNLADSTILHRKHLVFRKLFGLGKQTWT